LSTFSHNSPFFFSRTVIVNKAFKFFTPGYTVES
jgi:hypothetical protein